MPIQFDCENCHKRLKVPDSAAGKRGRCNECGHLNAIPAVASAEAAADLQPATDGETPTVRAAPTVSANGTYSVKSAVNGAVFGPADSATLQQWLDEGRITPDCQLKQTGTETWSMASQMFPALGAVAATAGSNGPFSQLKQTPEAQTNSGELNPYAPSVSPHPHVGPEVRREIVPTTGDIGFCISHGWNVWKQNFGLLLAVSATVLGVSYGFQILQALAQGGLAAAGGAQMMVVGIGLFTIISTLVQAWLGLGFAKVLCQLCRGERAEYATLFRNGGRLPLLILLGVLLYLPFVLVFGGIFLVVGPEGFGPGDEAQIAIVATILGALGILMLLGLILWPVYYLLADTRIGVGEMLRKGSSIGLKNCLVIIPIIFVAGFASMIGIVACGVGIVATLPAGQAMIATAYLNMSGQVRPR